MASFEKIDARALKNETKWWVSFFSGHPVFCRCHCNLCVVQFLAKYFVGICFTFTMRTGLNSHGQPCCVPASDIGHSLLTPHPDFTITPTRSIPTINRPSRLISARAATVRVLRVLHSPPDGVGWHHQRQTGDDDEQAHQLLQHQPSSHAGRPAVIAPATGRHRRHRRRRRAQAAVGEGGSRRRRTVEETDRWQMTMRSDVPRWSALQEEVPPVHGGKLSLSLRCHLIMRLT